MLFEVDVHDELPIYEQIVRQVVSAVAEGQLRPGDLVPSVREVARELAINPNTVQRAYRLLQERGILEPVRGTGLAIAPQTLERCQRERELFVRERLERALREALRSGVPARRLKRLLNELLTQLNGQENAPARAP